VKIAFSIPTATPISYPVAAIAGSAELAGARRFIDYLASPAAQSVLARHGFQKP
jgi:molybdate transport system substrate-binding protein